MPVDAGDTEEKYSVALDAGDNDVSGGDAVKFDGDGDITKTTANADDYVGVVLPEKKDGDHDDVWTVHVCGLVVNVVVDGTADAGDTLVPSGDTDGHWEAHDAGMYVADGDTDDIAANHPFVLEDAEDGDTVRAVFR